MLSHPDTNFGHIKFCDLFMCIGQSSPVQPRGVQTVNTTAYSTSVQWLVPYLTYTQEQYIVNYGTGRESLDTSSEVQGSTANISAVNVTYYVSLQELAPNTGYYYQIRSTNSRGSTLSPIMMFTTSEAGELVIETEN